MQITIDTNNLSDLDINMLAFLAEQGEVAEDEPEAPAPTAAPAKKAAAKKAAPPKAEAAAKDPEPEPEAEEDLVGGEEPEPEAGAPTMSDAVAAATQLVSAGESAKVKAALAEVGAKRVSEMAEEDIPAFLAALEA